MEQVALNSLIALAGVFTVLKICFSGLAYLFQEADRVHRQQLDLAFDALNRHTLFDLARITLLRVLEPIDHFFQKGRQAWGAIVFLSLVQNAIVFTVVATAVIATHFQLPLLGIGSVLFSIREAGLLKFTAMNAIVATLGMAFDVFSLWVTLVLVRRASVANTARALSKHLLIDGVVALLSCTWAYVMLSIALAFFYSNIYANVDYFSGGSAHRFIATTLWSTLSVNPAMWYVVVGLGISAALPTLVYLAALGPVIALRIVPRGVQNFVSLVILRLTTDKDPVLKQVSSFVSSVGALIAGIIPWLKTVSG